MDLRESHQVTTNRHPWELARIRALQKIISIYQIIKPGAAVLDLGCGDGFLIDGLCLPSTGVIDAVDIHLTAEQLLTFSATKPRIKFHNSYQSLTEKGYDLITMFDVLEHVADDRCFLQETISRFAKPGTLLFCTAPAFLALFSSHDTFLKHHRRYNLPALIQILNQAGLEVVGSGYLFGFLLPIRAASVLAENLFGATDTDPGIGHWRHGRFVTSMLTTILNADNCLLRWLNRLGIKLPGLTVWAVCKRLQ